MSNLRIYFTRVALNGANMYEQITHLPAHAVNYRDLFTTCTPIPDSTFKHSQHSVCVCMCLNYVVIPWPSCNTESHPLSHSHRTLKKHVFSCCSTAQSIIQWRMLSKEDTIGQWMSDIKRTKRKSLAVKCHYYYNRSWCLFFFLKKNPFFRMSCRTNFFRSIIHQILINCINYWEEWGWERRKWRANLCQWNSLGIETSPVISL